MFAKIKKTDFPPKDKPMMVWDGECGFCKYWITYWKSKTGDRIDYRTFQEIANKFQDIPLKEFKKASRLIEPDGSVYSGPDSAFRTFKYFTNSSLSWHTWYSRSNLLTFFSDHSYNYIAKNRSFMFKLTKLFFGNDPKSIKHQWLLILFGICVIAFLLFKFL